MSIDEDTDGNGDGDDDEEVRGTTWAEALMQYTLLTPAELQKSIRDRRNYVAGDAYLIGQPPLSYTSCHGYACGFVMLPRCI